jgi:hypothetical protein
LEIVRVLEAASRSVSSGGIMVEVAGQEASLSRQFLQAAV